MEKDKQKKSFFAPIIDFALLSIILFLLFLPGIILADDIIESGVVSVSAIVPPDNIIIFSGKACPFCSVYLERDGVPADSDTCDNGANFQLSVEDIPAGTYLFEIYAVDTDGIYSNTSSFTITISSSRGTLTTVSDILISPTLQSDKSSITEGDEITFFGQTVPAGAVTIVIDGSSPFIQVNAASDGEFYYIFDSSSLSVGSHSAEARVTADSIISPYSLPVEFEVEEAEAEEEEEDTCSKADYSDDDKVGLVDFSILLHWYGENDIPDEIDLDSDSKADLTDFSILLYCWDG